MASNNQHTGYWYPADKYLHALIDYILIGPGSAPYHLESITKLLEITGLGAKQIKRSTLLDEPMEQIKAMLNDEK